MPAVHGPAEPDDKPQVGRVSRDGEQVIRGAAANEQPGSRHDSQMRTQADYKSKRVTSAAADVTVFDGAARIGSIINENAGAATIILKDGATSLMTITLAANAATDVLRGQRFPSSLVVNTSVQPIAVQYREAIFAD